MKHLLALAVMVAGCADSPSGGIDATSRVAVWEGGVGVNASLDLLIVVDSSAAMAEHQEAIAEVARTMIARHDAQTAALLDGVTDLRLGVVSMDATEPTLREGRYLARSDRFAWEYEQNFTGDVATNIADLMAVGASTTTPRQPLAVIDAVLAAGDLHRDDAYLGIMLLTTGDDEGSEDVATVAARWRAAVPESRLLISAAIGCGANDSPRLRALLAEFPNRSYQTTMCSDDLASLIDPFAGNIRVTLGLPCWQTPPREPLECTSVLIHPETRAQVELPVCAGDDAHCWAPRPEVGCESGVSLNLPTPPFSAIAHIECVVDGE